MALFQPTFVIPSTRTEGTVDVNDNMEVKWQVNGQSAMIAFKIDFFRNDWSSTFVTTTGKQPVANGGFRGIDRFGKVKFYTYAPSQTTWYQFGLVNGNHLFINGMQYKMQITQYYIDNPNEYYVRTSAVIDKETACYFGMPNQANPSQVDYYLSFTLPEGKYPMGTKISYNISSENGFVIKNNALEFLTMTKSTTKPTEGTDLGIATNEESVVQRSMDVFRTFTKPTMALYKTPNEDFIWQDGVGEELLNPRNLSITTTMDLGAGTNNYFSFIQNGTQTYYASFTATNAISANTIIFYNAETKQGYYELNGEQVNLTITESTTQPIGANDIGKAYIDLATSIGYFHTNYLQEQGKPIRWVEWQVATANNGVVGDIIADTGKINTQTLDYSYNGFFNGQQYAIRCYGYSESEQYCDTGWIIFNVNIKAQGEYTGKFTVQCLPKENATLLQWEGVEVIPPRVSPEGYKPLIANGSVTLAPKNPETGEEYSVTWDKQLIYDKDSKETKTIPMNFEEPWTAVWKSKASFKNDFIKNIELPDDEYVIDASFSPNGNIFVVVGGKRIGTNRTGIILIYKVNGEVLEKTQEFPHSSPMTYLLFSPKGDIFITNLGYIYSVKGIQVEYKGQMLGKYGSVLVDNASFTPNGKMLAICQAGAITSEYFAVDGYTITFIDEIKLNGVPLQYVNIVAFSPDGKNLLMSAQESTGSYVYLYNIINDRFQFNKKLTKNGTDNWGEWVLGLSYHPNGEFVAISGGDKFRPSPTNPFVSIFSVVNGNYTYEGDVVLPEISSINNSEFSYSGDEFCISVNVSNSLLFSVNGMKLEYIKTIDDCDKVIFNPTQEYWIYLYNLDMYSFVNAGQGTLLSLMLNDRKLELFKQDISFTIVYNNTTISEPLYVDSFDSVTAIIQNSQVVLNFYNNGELQEKKIVSINLSPEPITSISINGGNNGIIVDSVSVFKGDGEDIVQLYDNDSNFEPVWNSEDYQLYMTANFNGNLEGGTGTSTGSGFRVYRREYNSSVMFPIATVPSTTLQVKDFGLRSGNAYEYYLYVYDSNGSFMTNVEGNQRVAAKYNSYSLMVCDYDSDRDEYHVRKQYLFALNASEGAMSNNNTPTINKNFTSYPTIMNSTSNYVSGTLSSLIGVIYTVPALIEQIGTYKYIKKPSTLEYFDTVDLQKELFQLSTLPYQLFLRDKKGNMRMIKIISPISMTVNSKQTQLSTSISLQWAEIDNADDMTVVQTPDDYGWDYDKELLDVKLDVDTNSGLLSATYPRNYRGTTFSLVGANKEILQANTPIGITPADITFSNVATKTIDGTLTATIKINKE